MRAVHMKNIPDSLTPEEAWRHLLSVPSLPLELRNLNEARDHILGEEFRAPEDVPVRDRSFMDGYAVRFEDLSKVPVELKVIGEIGMGESPHISLQHGEAVYVPTGAFLPDHCDAVVMQEDTDVRNGMVLIKKVVHRGENIQSRAEDFRKGDLLFPSLQCLRPQDLATIATFGVTHVRVHRKPVLRVVSTGNELVPYFSQLPTPGQIRETNALTLVAAAQKFGFSANSSGIIRDEFELQRNAVEEALRSADVVLISGGSSVGEKDHTRDVITSIPNHKLYFHGLAIRPGNPTLFASVGSQYIWGLPGQPVSSLIVFYQFVLPFLLHLSGEKIQFQTFHPSRFHAVSARLMKPVPRLKNKTDYFRVRLQSDGESIRAIPVPGKSASLSTLSMADGVIIISPGSEPVEEGTTVTVFLFP